MVPPKVMCRKHLLGEHVECHMFYSVLRKGKVRIDGYIRNNLLEPLSLGSRHTALAKEMSERGYSHRSLLPPDWDEIYKNPYVEKHVLHRVDNYVSMVDLFSRCKDCRAKAAFWLKVNPDTPIDVLVNTVLTKERESSPYGSCF